MPDNSLAPPNMPWLWQPNSPVGQPNGLGPSAPSWDDIVRQYLAMPTQNDTAVQYQPYPGSGARVPPDKLMDAPVVVYDQPPVEDQTNPYIQYEPDAPAPVVAPDKDITMNKVARRNDQLANLPGDLGALAQGANNSQQQSPNYAGSMFDRAAPLNAPGLIAPGNINIHQRPVVQNADGSVSTVRSMTFTTPDGKAVLVPSVIAGRGVVSPQEAYRYYQQTGQHLGVFDTPENADAYAQALHEQQATEYAR